jgi:hypothetical protein
VLCAENEDLRYSVEFDESTGRAVFQSIRCRKGTKRETYCLVREGRAPSLAWFSPGLAALDFANFASKYNPLSFRTHSEDLTTTAVWGDGASKAVYSYDRQGPIRVWMAQQLFLSLIPKQWEREFEKTKCEGFQ